MYLKSTDVNGKPSWASLSYAMWYSSNSKWWIIGSHRDIGDDTPMIYTKSQTGELPDETSVWFDICSRNVGDIKIQYSSGSNCHLVQKDGWLQRMRNRCTSKKPKLDGKSYCCTRTTILDGLHSERLC